MVVGGGGSRNGDGIDSSGSIDCCADETEVLPR